MANYKEHPILPNVLIEQNIYSDSELRSFDILFTDFYGATCPHILAYSENNGKRFYSVELQKWADKYYVVGDLSDVFKWKSAQARRKRIELMIQKNEALLGNPKSSYYI